MAISTYILAFRVTSHPQSQMPLNTIPLPPKIVRNIRLCRTNRNTISDYDPRGCSLAFCSCASLCIRSSRLFSRSCRNFATSSLISLRSYGILGCSSGFGQKLGVNYIVSVEKRGFVHVGRIDCKNLDGRSSTLRIRVASRTCQTTLISMNG
jgi:hypothetical protein